MLSGTFDYLSIGKKMLCKNLRIDFEPGYFYCIMGANGSGKTTLLHTLSGLLKTDHGQILLQGKPLYAHTAKERATIMGVLLQDQPVPFFTSVHDGLQAARYPHANSSRASDEQHIQHALSLMELDSFENKFVHELSGGEQQRFHIGMLITQNPMIYILDEPTNHLDLRYQIKILQKLKAIAQDEKKTIITAIHDINLIFQFADRVCFLYEDGATQQGDTIDMFCEKKLSALYQQPIKKFQTLEGQTFWRAT